MQRMDRLNRRGRKGRLTGDADVVTEDETAGGSDEAREEDEDGHLPRVVLAIGFGESAAYCHGSKTMVFGSDYADVDGRTDDLALVCLYRARGLWVCVNLEEIR